MTTEAVLSLGAVRIVPTDDVKPAADNPRKMPTAAVEVVGKSLKQFGWQQPIVVDKDMTVIAGHTRLAAAKKLGLEQVPVVVATGLTEGQIKAYRIADNRTHDYTSWDFAELAVQLEDLAPDFADVLGLADWQGVLDELEDLTVDVPPDVRSDVEGGFEVVVVFQDKEAALAQEEMLMDLPGVLDVRHRLKVHYDHTP